MARKQFSTGVQGIGDMLNKQDQTLQDTQQIRSDVSNVNANVDTAKAGIGTNTDAAGTGTLFGWAKKKWDWLTGTLWGAVDEIEPKLGSSTDAAGTTTVFARVRQIYEYLTTNLSTTRAAKIDTIDTKTGTNADAAGTNTLFARARQIYDYLYAYLSVARVTKFDKWLGTYRVAIYGIASGTYSSSSQYIDLIGLTGSGCIHDVEVALFGNSVERFGLQVVIDGVEHNLDFFNAGANYFYSAAVAGYMQYSGMSGTVYPMIKSLKGPLYFNSSFLLRLHNRQYMSASNVNGIAKVGYSN